jgi:hypothetical protein
MLGVKTWLKLQMPKCASVARLIIRRSHTLRRAFRLFFGSVKEDAGSQVHFCGATQMLLLSRVRGEEGWHSGVPGWLHIYTNLTRRACRANRIEPRRVSALVVSDLRGRRAAVSGSVVGGALSVRAMQGVVVERTNNHVRGGGCVMRGRRSK